jgi:hypothetical protein
MKTLDIGRPLNGPELEARRIPTAGAMEAVEECLFDTVNYPAAGVAVGNGLDFFVVQQNDDTLSNLRQPGQLPVNEYFHAKRLFLVPLIESVVDADILASSLTRDIERILFTSRGMLTLTPSKTGRPRGPVPIHMIGGVGGVEASYGGNSAPAAGAAAITEQVKTSRHGGYPIDLILKGPEAFSARIKFGVQLAVAAAVPLQLILYGFRYKAAA